MPYEEFNRRKQEDESYCEKRFLSLHGMLMEVTEEEYVSYYKDKRRYETSGRRNNTMSKTQILPLSAAKHSIRRRYC